MANPNRNNQPKVARTEQDVANSGFDEIYQVPTVELLAYNAATQSLDRVQINSSGNLLTDASLTMSGDIEIGAVELKNATTDDRQTVDTKGQAYTTQAPLATRTDSATTTNVTYIGRANIGTATSAASWQVQKVDETTANTAIITWADGNAAFDNIWDNRASLSFS